MAASKGKITNSSDWGEEEDPAGQGGGWLEGLESQLEETSRQNQANKQLAERFENEVREVQ